MAIKAPDGRILATEDIEITDLEWLVSLTATDQTWEEDCRISEMELLEDLQGSAEFSSDSTGVCPDATWEDAADFDFLSDIDESSPGSPRYQIQVRIEGGG